MYAINEENNRSDLLDLIRGLLIVLMVIGHSGSPSLIERFIYLFHLTAFMILSGYCYNSNNCSNFESVKKYLYRKINKMYFPYILANGILILLHNILVRLHLYSTISSSQEILTKLCKNFVFCGTEQLLGALWYLRTLFIIVNLWIIVDYLIHIFFLKKSTQFFTGGGYALCMLLIGYLLNKYDIKLNLSIPCIFTYTFFYVMGIFFSRMKMFETISLKLQILLTLMSMVVLIIIDMYTNWIGATGSNEYTDIITMLFMSILGWIFIKGIAIFIKSNFKLLSDILIKIGRNTMAIMFFHFIAFKLVILIQIFIFDLPIETLSYFPIYDGSNLWWILYSLSGIVMPIFLRTVYIKIKIKLKTIGLTHHDFN